MKKYIVPGWLVALLFPRLALATSYDMGMVKLLLVISIFDEIILFLILPILIIFLIVRIKKYTKTITEDPIKEKRKGKVYKSIVWIAVFTTLWLILSKQPGSEPCGFNMNKSCPVSFSTILSRIGILKPELDSTNCPPNMVVVTVKGKPLCT